MNPFFSIGQRLFRPIANNRDRLRNLLNNTRTQQIIEQANQAQSSRNKQFAQQVRPNLNPRISIPKVSNFIQQASQNPQVARNLQAQRIQRSVERAFENSVGRARPDPADMARRQLRQAASPMAPLRIGRDLAIGGAREIAKLPETYVRSSLQLGGDLADSGVDFSSGKNTGLRRLLYGSGSVETLQKRTAGNKKTIEESRFRNLAGPLSILGLGATIGLDAPLGFGSKQIGKELLEQVAKESTEQGWREVSEQGLKQFAKKQGFEFDQKTLNSLLDDLSPITNKKAASKAISLRAGEAVESGIVRNISEQMVKSKTAEQFLKSLDAPTIKTIQAISKTTNNPIIKEVADSIQGKAITPTLSKIVADAVPTRGINLGQVKAPKVPDILQEVSPEVRAELDNVAQNLGLKNADELAEMTRTKGASDITEASTGVSGPNVNTPLTDTITGAVQEAESARKAGKQNIWARGYQATKRELFDPKQEYQRLDDRYAKSQGKKLTDIDPNESLIYLSRRAETSPQEAVLLAQRKTPTGRSLADVMARYPDRSSEATFMQYLNQKFALEIYEKSGRNPRMWKVPNVTPEEVAASVARYEMQINPTAIADAATVKKWADSLIDKGVQSGEISKEFGEIIKARYQNYVPLSKVFSEDLIRPKIVGGIGSTVGEQNVVRFLGEGGAVWDDSFGSLVTRGDQVVKKANINQFNNELLRRQRLGVHGDKIRLQIDPDKVSARRQIIDQLRQLKKTIQEQTVGRNKSRLGSRLGKKDLQIAEKEAAEKARQYYMEQATDPRGVSWAKGLSHDEALDMFRILTDTDSIKAKRIATKLAKKGAQYERAVQELQSARGVVNASKEEFGQLFRESVGLSQKTETGKNVVKGFRGGDEFALELDPALARQTEYINSLKDDQIGRLSGAIAAPSKVLYTGALALPFQVKDVVRRQGLKFTNTPGLSAFGARPLTTGYFGGLTGHGKFYKGLLEVGFTPPTATKVATTPGMTAKAIAASSSKLAKLKYTATRPKEWWHILNRLGGRLDVADRVEIAKGEYIRRMRQPGMTHDTAMKYAARAAQEAMGDFQRVSKLARRVEGILPYSGATQAGHRALMRRFRTNPVETGVKILALTGTVAGVAKYNADKNRDYYEDMIASGRTWDLDSNVIIVTPGAHKVTEEEAEASDGKLKEGEWTGVIKIPVAPDYNPLTRAAWRTGYSVSKGDVPDIGMIATELKNFVTADQQKNLVDPQGRKGFGIVLPNSPIKNTGMILAGLDPRTSRPLAGEALTNKKRSQQFTEYTSETAKQVSEAFGGILTPQQLDALADASGFFGDVLQAKEGLEAATTKPFKNIFLGSKGESAGARYYKVRESAIKTVGLDENELDAFNSAFPSRKDFAGEEAGQKTYYDGKHRAATFERYPKTFEVAKLLDQDNRSQGKPGDPLFDLPPEQRRVMLHLSTLSPGNREAAAILKLNPWIKDYYKQRSDFFDKIKANQTPEEQAKSGIDPMGIKIPSASAPIKTKLTQLEGIEDKKQRALFYENNPDVLDFFTQQEDYQRAKRSFMGLPLFDQYPKPSEKVQKYLDVYNKLPKDNGPLKRDGTPSSPQRSAWIKSHPKEWEQMTDYFNIKSQYDLAQAGSLAVYEGIGFNEDDYKDILSLAKSSGGGYGGFGFGSRNGGENAIGGTSEGGLIDVTDFLNKFLKSSTETPKVKAPQVRVKIPAAAPAPRIRISSLTLPTRAPTYGTGRKRG